MGYRKTHNFHYYDKQKSSLRPNLYLRGGKRFFDVVLALVLLPLVIPLILIIAALAYLEGGSAFFVHRRVGENGREFGCIKIRTMAVDAEARLQRLLARNPAARREWEQNYKLIDDPRTTPLGRFLRKSSLDELPQIFNVLKGDMSFVGPRPIPRNELKMYGRASSTYTAGRPGITGLWQISGRNALPYSTRIQLDVRYRESEGFWSDVGIILKTGICLLRRDGF